MRTPRLKSRPTRVPALLGALLTVMVLAIAPVAFADVGETIIQRCTHGKSLSGFSQRDYSRALKELSADAEEYTDCSSLIRQAQVAAAAGKQSGGGGQSGGSAAASTAAVAASPAEQQSVAHAAIVAPKAVSLNGQVIHPGIVHASIASALSSLPTPLIAILALLLACLAVVVGGAVRNRIRAGRSD